MHYGGKEVAMVSRSYYATLYSDDFVGCPQDVVDYEDDCHKGLDSNGSEIETADCAALLERLNRDKGPGWRATDMGSPAALLLLSLLSDPAEDVPEDRLGEASGVDSDGKR